MIRAPNWIGLPLLAGHYFTVNANGETTIEFHKVRVAGCEGISEGD